MVYISMKGFGQGWGNQALISKKERKYGIFLGIEVRLSALYQVQDLLIEEPGSLRIRGLDEDPHQGFCS